MKEEEITGPQELRNTSVDNENEAEDDVQNYDSSIVCNNFNDAFYNRCICFLFLE